MPVRILGWITVLLLSSGCSLLFSTENSAEDDANSGVCTGCTTSVGLCIPEPGPGNCGAVGGTCEPCNPLKADTCVNGFCLCGEGAACGENLQCVNGACVCNGQTCSDGCCSDIPTCREGDITMSCGDQGNPCEVCDPLRADTCGINGCQCGDGDACEEGLRCENDSCVCDSVSCDGCCTTVGPGGTCITDTNETACGNAGAECTVCSAGANPMCLPGGICSGCVAGCPDGCCNGDTCLPAGVTTCGVAGAACVACGIEADTCSDTGECLCGNGNPCLAGQQCIGGTCECTPTSCAGGCCEGDLCQLASDSETCGIGGQVCQKCDIGQVCDLGVCECNFASCPDGCCDSAGSCIKEVAQGNNACGTSGDMCGMCSPAEICVAGSCDVPATDSDGGVMTAGDGGPI